MIRVVLDTNVVVAAVTSPTGPNSQLLDFITAERIRPYVTEVLLANMTVFSNMNISSTWISGS